MRAHREHYIYIHTCIYIYTHREIDAHRDGEDRGFVKRKSPAKEFSDGCDWWMRSAATTGGGDQRSKRDKGLNRVLKTRERGSQGRDEDQREEDE